MSARRALPASSESVSDLLATAALAGAMFAVLLTILALFPAIFAVVNSQRSAQAIHARRTLKLFVAVNSTGALIAGAATAIPLVRVEVHPTTGTVMRVELGILLAALAIAAAVVPILARFVIQDPE